jgi:hypothetical protein
MSDDVRLQVLARGVVARWQDGDAIIVPFREVGMHGPDGDVDWLPLPHRCHDNVAAWVSVSPHHKAVRGYVLFPPNPLYGGILVQAHTVVEMEEGAFDITPTGASQSYPFVRHTGTDEEFELMAAAVRVVVPVKFG